jgi:hypothetical protein
MKNNNGILEFSVRTSVVCSALLSLGAFSQSSENTTTAAAAVTTTSATAAAGPAPASAASTAAAAGSSVAEIAPKSVVHVKYSNYMNGPTLAKATGVSINHIATVKYDFKNAFWLSANFRFDSTFGDTTNAASLEDPYLILGTSTANLGSVTMKGQLWYTVGMSEAAKKADLVSVLQPRVTFERSIKKFTITNDIMPKFYIRDTSRGGQKFAVLGNYLNVSYEVNKTITLDMGMYPEFAFLRAKPTQFNDLAVYPGFTASFGKNLSISPYFEIFAANPKAETTSVGAFLSATIL